MIRLFSCFAGYGTDSFALKSLGIDHDLVGYSEIEPAAIKCFEQNHGGKNFGDITKIDWSVVPDFDLLTGGFPCQSFSNTGKGLGEKDYRGQLGLELTKALIEKKPKYFVFENVKGFLNGKFNDFGIFLVNSWKNAGYRVVYKVLNTKDYGIPQNRDRIWFIGVRKDIPERFFNWPVPFELKLKLGDLLEKNIVGDVWLSEDKLNKIFKNLTKLNRESAFFTQPMNESWISKTLTCGGEKIIRQNSKYRHLTGKEVFRLQGFIEDEVNLEGLSVNQCYKLAGNGQSVNVLKLLFKELLKEEL